ncbi:ATG21 Autophagy-related protein 21 [Candida maltosa Xu316]
MVQINDLSFNPDYTSISVSTSEGFKIFNCEPFGEFYSSQDSPLRKSISNSMEDSTGSPTRTSASNEDISSNNCPTVFTKMLFSSSLTIVVPQSQENKLLKIYNLKQNFKICDLNFPSSIIDIKVNRKRLIVILNDGKIYIYDLSCVRLLKILQLQFGDNADGNSGTMHKFIGDLGADDNSWLVIPITYTTSTTDLLSSENLSQPSTPRLKPSDSVVNGTSYDKYIEFTRNSSSTTLNKKSKSISLEDIKKDSEGWVVVYDTINLVPVLIFHAHNSAIGRICTSPKENKIATASVKGTIIRVFDLKKDEEDGKTKILSVKNLRRGHNLARINSLHFHNDNQILGCGSDSNTIHLFKISGTDTDDVNDENEQDKSNHNSNSEYEDSDAETSKSSEDLNENLANLLISKPPEPVPTHTNDKNSNSWFSKTKKLINNQYTSSIIKKIPYKDYFDNLIWEPPRRSFAYIKLPEYIPNSEKEPKSNKVEIGFNNDLVFIASYHTGNFYQYQMPKHKNSMLRSSLVKPNCLLLSSKKIIATRMSSSLTPNPTAGAEEPVVLTSTKNHARIITLNRVRKLNSLNTEMIELMTPPLVGFAKEKANNVTILTSNSPKALCAGGDVAECAVQIRKGNPGYGADFFDKEYNLNYIISTLPKPYISLMDGITFGGGVGLSVHAPFRVATEKTKLAMPEMDIGFFPDVGTTFFLPRLDDKIGYYVALTGAVLPGLDAYIAGFATHYIKSEKIPQLINRLASLQPPEIEGEISVVSGNNQYFSQVNDILNDFSEKKLPSDYKFFLSSDDIATVNKAFSQNTIDDVFKYLEQDGSPFAKKTLDTLLKKPKSSLAVALALMNRGAENSIKQQFELEMVSATNILAIPAEHNDFAKGVIHKLVDKIKDPFFPKWNDPSTIDEKYVKDTLSLSKNTEKYLKEPYIKKWFGIDFKEYPHQTGLPTNKDVANYIAGTDGSNRTYLPTPAEVFKHFKIKTNDKLGVDLKIKQILDLHGETAKYDHKYVTWKDEPTK